MPSDDDRTVINSAIVSRTKAGLQNVDALQVQELEGSKNHLPEATTRSKGGATDVLKANSGLKVDFGRGTDASLIDKARLELKDVPAVEAYRRRSDAKIPFEALEHRPICKAVVDSWVEHRDNVRRIENLLGRTMKNEEFLHGYAAVKMKNLPRPGRVAEGLAKSKDFVVVLIALETWNQNNGFFLSDVELASGDDIIVNGGDEIIFPGHGGALVVILYFTAMMNEQE